MKVNEETSFVEEIRYAIVWNTIPSWEENRKDKEMEGLATILLTSHKICFIKNQVTLNATGPLKVMGCDLKPVNDVKPILSQGFKL